MTRFFVGVASGIALVLSFLVPETYLVPGTEAHAPVNILLHVGPFVATVAFIAIYASVLAKNYRTPWKG